MPNNLKLANASVNAGVAPIGTLLNSGYLRIYDGAQPANADTAISGQVLLAELRFSSTAFGAPANGVLTAAAITDEDAALASGNAAWFRALSSNGTTVVADGSVGTSGSDLNLNSVAFAAGAKVSITSLTLTLPKNA
jgi:hypothetical protein